MFSSRFWLILTLVAVTLVTGYAVASIIRGTASVRSAIANQPANRSIDDYMENKLTVRS